MNFFGSKISSLKGPLLLGVFYSSPSPYVSALEELNSSLSLISENCPIIMCGDFNVPNINWSLVTPIVSSSAAASLCSVVNNNYLTQLVHLPTRGERILDLVLINCMDCFSPVMIAANLPHTDHDAVEFFVSALPLN